MASATGCSTCGRIGDKIRPRPQATPGLDAMMDEVAANIFKVFEALKPTGTFLSTPIKVPAHLEAQRSTP